MSTNTRVVLQISPHKNKQGARGMQKINWPEIVKRAREEKWHWQPPDDIPADWDRPLMSVVNKRTGERWPWYRLKAEQQEQIRRRVVEVLTDAIKKQLAIMEIRSQNPDHHYITK